LIKKINNLLIIITLVGSILVLCKSKIDLVNILKILSIFFTINIGNIIKKYVYIDDNINHIYIIFIILAHFLGVILNLYNSMMYYDKLVHFLFGFVSSYIIYKLLNKSNINIIFIVMTLASFWEIFEYLSSIILNVDPQNVLVTGVNDTMQDIIAALFGTLLFCLKIINFKK